MPIFFGFGWGAPPPQTPRILAEVGKAPPTPTPKRLILAFDRDGQMGPPRSNDFVIDAANDTSAADEGPKIIQKQPKFIRKLAQGFPLDLMIKNPPFQ